MSRRVPGQTLRVRREVLSGDGLLSLASGQRCRLVGFPSVSTLSRRGSLVGPVGDGGP